MANISTRHALAPRARVSFWARSVAIGAIVAACPSLFACSATSYLGYRLAPDYPRDESQTLELPGLEKPVAAFLDDAGVSHIQAQTETDLVRTVGFMQARSRFFGMDMMRRFARGRLSELVGEQKVLSGTTIEFDTSMRGWGFDAAASQDAAELDAESLQLMTAYTEGVNSALQRYKPLEYRLLGTEPEPWKLEDSFALGRLNAWSVSHNWHQELSRLLLALHVGWERAEQIYNNEWWNGGTSIPPQGPQRQLPPALAPELRSMFPARQPAPPTAHAKLRNGLPADIARMGGASNGWVIGGLRSASGMPIVANDPHMAHLLPSILFQQHLSAPGVDVIGAAIPGLPYVLAGHNQRVAWGMTSAVADAIDLYIEKLNPQNPDQYEVNGKFVPFQREEHIVRVRDGSTMHERKVVIRRTGHGPLLNDMYPKLLPSWSPPVALSWNLTGVAKSIPALRAANRARNVESLRQALLGMASPVTTWQAADVTGRIAIFATGTVPLRPSHLGTFPVPGWTGTYEWQGTIPANQMPLGSSNGEGWLAHANNLMTDPSHSTSLFHVDSAPSYRLDRINQLVAARDKHTPQSVAADQCDVKLLRAERLSPKMLEDLRKAQGLGPMDQKAVQLLETWDYNAPASSAATAIFFVTYREAIIHALQDEVDAAGFEFILSQRYSTNVADLWFDDPKHPVWDDRRTPGVEGRADVLVPAFRAAVARIAGEQGPEPSAWRWGKIHDVHPKHLFGSKDALADFVNLPAVEAEGGLDSVWKSHFDLGHPSTPFRAMAGPVYRMIIDLGNIRNGQWIIDTGNSGWPGSPHYGDQHGPWKRCEYLPMVSDWSQIRKTAGAVISLQPKK